jgi:hypothetical protein
MTKNVCFLVSIAIVFASPGWAQIVNGNNGGNGSPPAPIGTEAGGSDAAQQAPGEAAATAGAMQNDRDDRTMQNTTSQQAARNARARNRQEPKPQGTGQ